MKYKWLNKVNNDDLIVFFNGWGMDESVVSHLDFANHDLLMFYNYNSIETDFPFYELDKYSTKTLVAWSMGVMTASLFDINYDYKVAINGTLKPIDNMYGIPVRIYDLAKQIIRYKGLVPGKDIKITVTGLRPGEKLYEEMLMKEEGMKETPNKLIHIGKPIKISETFMKDLDKLIEAANKNDGEIKKRTAGIVDTYKLTKENNNG